MENISYSSEAVRKSLIRLERDGLIKKVGERYVTTAIIRSKPITVKPQGRIHTIAVEKIYPGFAVVMVDDSFRARLEPSAYNGPRDLIKKGRRFKARATVTKVEGATTVLIHDVVEAQLEPRTSSGHTPIHNHVIYLCRAFTLIPQPHEVE
jgi:Fanconi anemia group M protein